MRHALVGLLAMTVGGVLMLIAPTAASAAPHGLSHHRGHGGVHHAAPNHGGHGGVHHGATNHGGPGRTHHTWTHQRNAVDLYRSQSAVVRGHGHRLHVEHRHGLGVTHGQKRGTQHDRGHDAAATTAPAPSTRHRTTGAARPRTQQTVKHTTTVRTIAVRSTPDERTRTVADAFDAVARHAARAVEHVKQPRAAHRSHPASAAPAARAPAPAVVAPLRDLGDTIGKVPGFSVFGGPLGWVFTGLLLLGVTMIVVALTIGRRRATSNLAA